MLEKDLQVKNETNENPWITANKESNTSNVCGWKEMD